MLLSVGIIAEKSGLAPHAPKPFREVIPGAPREIERIVTNCLRKDPRRRFQHMEDIRILLDSLREDWQSRQFSGVMTAPVPPARRIPFVLVPICLARRHWSVD